MSISMTLACLSLVFGSISMLATIFAFFWFVKMRRSFRHDLIMLLMQSDCIKAFWFTLFPIVHMARGPVASSSAFCQASGFFLTVGIESSDTAVLLIALNGIMYILRPKSGLYPYRKYAYAAWVLFPLSIASLAFIDGAGYENVGHYCYLKTDKSWSRLLLSWISRYVVCGVIVVIYIFVYVYVTRKMDRYGRRSSTSAPHQPQGESEQTVQVAAIPPIAYHGLIPGSRRASAMEAQDRQLSVSSVGTMKPTESLLPRSYSAANATDVARRAKAMAWNWTGFPQALSTRTTEVILLPDEEHQDPKSINTVKDMELPPAAHSTTRLPFSMASEEEETHFWGTPAPSLARQQRARNHSTFSIGSVLDRVHRSESVSITWSRPARPHVAPVVEGADDQGVEDDATTSTTDSTENAPVLLTSSAVETDRSVAKNRERMRRQLRATCVYPLAYIMTWVFPFISHISGYDGSLAPTGPAWLLVISTISLCSQGTVGCILFTVREKPWRHSRGGFWSSLWKLLSIDMVAGLAGRSREEMLVDSRLARERRDEEMLVERDRRARRAGIGAGPRRGSREWWDADPYERELRHAHSDGTGSRGPGALTTGS